MDISHMLLAKKIESSNYHDWGLDKWAVNHQTTHYALLYVTDNIYNNNHVKAIYSNLILYFKRFTILYFRKQSTQKESTIKFT